MFDYISQGIYSLNWLSVSDKLYLNEAVYVMIRLNV